MGHRFSKTAANAAYTTTPVNQAAHQTFCCSISKRPLANTSATATTATTTPVTTRTLAATPANSAICMAGNCIAEEMSSPLAQQMHVLPETPLNSSAHMNRQAILTNGNDGNAECSLTTTAINTYATTATTTSACNNFNPCECSGSNTNSNFQLNSITNSFEQSLANKCYAKTAAAAGILQHSGHNDDSRSHSLSSINNLSCGRQIIIKIQLAKMENGNGQTSTMQRQYQQLQASPALALSSSLSTMPSSTHLIESPITDGNQNVLDDTLLINKTAALPIITNTTTTATTTTADHSAAVALATLVTDVLTNDDQQLNLSLNIENQQPPLPLSTSLSTLWPTSHSSTLLTGTAGSSSEYTTMPIGKFHNRAIPNAALNISNDTSESHNEVSTIVPSIHTICDLKNATHLFNTAITKSDCGENRSSTKDRANCVNRITAYLEKDTAYDNDWSGHHHRHHLINGFMQLNGNDLKMQNADEAVDYYEVLEGNDEALAATAVPAVEAREAEVTSYSSSSPSPPPTPQTQRNNNNNNTNDVATVLCSGDSKTTCYRGKLMKVPSQSNATPVLPSSSSDRSSATSTCSVVPVTKWRYRDIFRRLLEPVSLRACNKAKHHRDERKPIVEQSFGRKCKKQHAEDVSEQEITQGKAVTTAHTDIRTSSMTASLLNDCTHSNTSLRGNVSQQEEIMTTASPISLVSAASTRSDTEVGDTVLARSATDVAKTTTVAAIGSSNSHLSIWASNRSNSSDVIIPIATQPQFVVVQCSILNGALEEGVNSSTNAHGFPSSEVNDLFTAAVDNANEVNVMLNESGNITSLPNEAKESVSSGVWIPSGPVVHSQIDFCHHLVPDLERIIQSSFYWGKMDRYEAERLLEGNPEGTFLLRDSAQEEFLFSVTFRKYGRSLHARIEQSGHRFSFDCHDPCVFTASTVTGLLEHYKDPACVMFFEPMLTIPLHRKTCFSLQQLCRATIVSHITYDGINKLELPSRLKSFLKEYHYKQKLRVKPFDEPYYI